MMTKIAHVEKIKMEKTKKNINANAVGKVGKITKDMKLNEIVKIKPDAAEILVDVGLGCAGCHFSEYETLESGFKSHGFTDEDINEIVKMLNS